MVGMAKVGRAKMVLYNRIPGLLDLPKFLWTVLVINSDNAGIVVNSFLTGLARNRVYPQMALKPIKTSSAKLKQRR